MNWISKYFRHTLNQTAETGEEWCVTLESNRNPNSYIQFTAEHVNLAYPRDVDPHKTLAELPSFPECKITSWESNSFLTMEHGIERSIEPLGEFVEHYILKILNLSADKSGWTITEQCL